MTAINEIDRKLAAAERSYRRQRTALRSTAMVIGTILFALSSRVDRRVAGVIA
jgi:hypothetical protein